MIYPSDFEVRIGFDKIKSDLRGRIGSNAGLELVDGVGMSVVKEEIQYEVECVNEMLTVVRMESDWTGGAWCDTRFLRKLNVVGVCLELVELVMLRRAIEIGSGVKRFFANHENYIRLREVVGGVGDFDQVRVRIDKIVDQNGRIKDNASVALGEIRREMVRKSNQVGAKLEQILKTAKAEGFAESDSSISIRDNRAVIPVAAGFKRKIKGIVHSESASGRTAFVEPLEVVELNNAIRELEIAETQEILRILAEFSDFVREFAEELYQLGECMGRLEFLEAKAKMANLMMAGMPIMAQEMSLNLRKARHPLLEKTLKIEGKKIVPLNLKLDNNERILLISGPNAGGKSVCLKSVGLLQYMYQCGFLVPMLENSEMTIFESIFIDIGDQQSIESDLSTYSSHLKNMNFFLRNANEKTLILIDEFGGGTEPTFGGAIAEAMLEEFLKKKCYGIVTTHYGNLKYFAAGNDGIGNGAMTFDVNKIEPLFELEQGRSGNSFAIEIARKIGLSGAIIDKAQELVGVDQVNIEKQLRQAARDKRYWEGKREKIKQVEKGVERSEEELNKQIEEIRAKRAEILQQAREEAKKLVAQANKQVEATIREIKEAQAQKERTLAARGALKGFAQKIENQVPEDVLIAQKMAKIKLQQEKRAKNKKENNNLNKLSDEIKKRDIATGDVVVIKGSSVPGNVQTIDGKNAFVLFGNVRMKVQIDQLEIANRQQKRGLEEKSAVKPQQNFSTFERKLDFKEYIDVRGERTVNALERVKLFVDEALMFGSNEVRILHGKGDGILKAQIREYLKSEKAVEWFGDEHVERGGAGITVVRF